MPAKAATVKIGPAIDKKLYADFVKIARENGQSQRFLLEKAFAPLYRIRGSLSDHGAA